MGRFTICRCYVCGINEFEERMLEYNDHHFCGIRCKKIQERKDDESLHTRTTVVRLPTSER